jgi:hypothetical protein
LNNALRANLEAAPRVLYSGEYGLTHHDPATASGDYYEGWSAEGELGGMPVRYLRAPESAMTVPDADHPLLEGVHAPEDATYPADQMAVFPEDAVEPLLLVGGYPMLALRDGGRTAHVCNRLFNHAWHSDARWMEDLAYGVLRNLMDACGVTRRVVSPPAFRANNVWPYGSYGVTGWFAWNALDEPVPITLRGGREITIPSNGWTLVPRPGA